MGLNRLEGVLENFINDLIESEPDCVFAMTIPNVQVCDFHVVLFSSGAMEKEK